MPKAVLEFSLPEEKSEFEMAQKAGSYYSIISDLRAWIRAQSKYKDRETVGVDELRDKLNEICKDHLEEEWP